jgi:hypothetical protein
MTWGLNQKWTFYHFGPDFYFNNTLGKKIFVKARPKMKVVGGYF